MSKQSITGRDGYIIRKALAYAIEAIELLPEERQEWSDMQDMRMLLDHLVSRPDFFLVGARSHLTGEDFGELLAAAGLVAQPEAEAA